MKMEVSFGGHIGSMLCVVALVVCFRDNASGERVQGCVGSELSLGCEEMKVINISDVVLGDTGCLGATCCIKDNDCIRDANANHVMDVHLRCNGQSSCTVNIIREEIECGYIIDRWSNNDFERITYTCINKRQKIDTNSVDMHPTVNTISQRSEPDDSGDNGRRMDVTTNVPGETLTSNV